MANRLRLSAGVGGTLALEFANTADWHLDPEPVERLRSWSDVVHWSAEQGLVSADQLDALLHCSLNIEPVLELREAIFKVALAAALGNTPGDDELQTVLAQSSVAPPDAVWRNGVLAWRYRDERALVQLLGLIARDAVAFFASERLCKMRLCEGGKCGWLFIDESRGRPRRWCSMSDCGNRAKARRAYSRRKG